MIDDVIIAKDTPTAIGWIAGKELCQLHKDQLANVCGATIARPRQLIQALEEETASMLAILNSSGYSLRATLWMFMDASYR